MSFDTYLKQAWNDHAAQTQKVAGDLQSGMKLIETDGQIVQMAGLITHVMGEHLGRWADGISLLGELSALKKVALSNESEKAILRSQATLNFGIDPDLSLSAFSLSDQVRILAAAASAFAERDMDRAQAMLASALALAEKSLDQSDPENRALAVTGNNLACGLEEKSSRTPEEVTLMITAALTGRKYWERAGTWLETERAEYRLANTYLKANQPEKALAHARLCVDVCKENQAAPVEFFFGYEALYLAERALENEAGAQVAADLFKQSFEQLSPDDKKWCESTRKKLFP